LALPTLTEEELAQEKQWAEDIKYHAARSIWKRRQHSTPSSLPHRRVTWEEWFEKKFGEPLLAYAERMRKK
tara:strand:+ start:204 stop:416 length:213 start_codon:yes stop_codon:yes gene_type:complete